jgi:hypothetical protein
MPLNGYGVRCRLGRWPLAAGAILTVRLDNCVQLGNDGGSLTLLDGKGATVTGVSYTADQARRDGWTVVF